MNYFSLCRYARYFIIYGDQRDYFVVDKHVSNVSVGPVFILDRHKLRASCRLPIIHMHQQHHITPEYLNFFPVRVHLVHPPFSVRIKKPLPQPHLLMDPPNQPHAAVNMAERLLVPRIIHEMPSRPPLGRVIHQPVLSDKRNRRIPGCILAFIVHVQ
jgi:hypothetical protein